MNKSQKLLNIIEDSVPSISSALKARGYNDIQGSSAILHMTLTPCDTIKEKDELKNIMKSFPEWKMVTDSKDNRGNVLCIYHESKLNLSIEGSMKNRITVTIFKPDFR